MPLPIPTPTADELEIVAEITMLTTDAVLVMISAYDQATANAKWERTLTDIDAWPDLIGEQGDIKRVGSIEFFENSIGGYRLSFRNTILRRYGQGVLLSESGVACGGLAYVSSLEWF